VAVAGLLVWAACGVSLAQTAVSLNLAHTADSETSAQNAAPAPAPTAQASAAAPASPASSPSGPGCGTAPLSGLTLYLRGSMNSWAPVEEYAFRWICDAYYLNIEAKGRQEFKVADADWSASSNFGDGPGGTLVLGGGNAARSFEGEHTLRLDVQGRSARLSVGPKRIADAPRREPTDPVALGLRFDSRNATHKQPFGAVAQRTAVRLAVKAPVGVESLTLVIESRLLEGNQDRLQYTEIARVPLKEQRAGASRDGSRTWNLTHRFDSAGVFGYWFEARTAGERYVIQNNNDAVHWTRERGSGGAGAVAFLPDTPRTIRRFRQTVFDPAFRVPDWAQDAIYYQIFPDRFRNGDPSNDPSVGRDRYRSGGIEEHARWTDKPYRPGSGDGSDAFFNNDFFGGDLAGITGKLDDLKALGINTLYLTPIFRAPSNHKYDTADYKAIDPAFGTEADFVRLTREAQRRGIRLLPDTSFNHVGSDSPYFDRYGNWPERGAFEGGKPDPTSPYASWFRFDTTKTDPDQQYAYWGGPDLPALDKASPSFRAYAFGAPDSVTRKWLDLGAAGWRMDVAPWVPDDFWRAWRRAVKQHRPDALTLAETWFDASKYFVGDMFDSTMNYVFRNAVLDYAAGGKAQDLATQLEHLREAYPPQVLKALMNLISSHDVARALHVLGWHDQPPDSPEARLAKARFRLATFVQMTQPGAPLVYYGDEVGLTGGEDPFNRGTYPWPDLGGQPDTALQAEVRRLIALRQQQRILRQGTVEPMRALDSHVTLSTRRLGTQRAWVLTNNSSEPRTVTLSDAPERLRDALSGEVLRSSGGTLVITVPAHFGRVVTSPVR
jgi:cyclomaltodextrinase / maltogenic alpha-amylase / neopullulanase